MTAFDLSRSEARRRILGLMFSDPEREFHMRGMERRIGMSIGAVQHVVGNLEREGLLKRRRLGNLALFSPNRKHPLYREMESVIARTVGIAPLLARALAGVPGVCIAFLYGSYASVFSKSPAWSGESDVDVLVVGDVDPLAVSRIAREAGEATGRQINYTVMTKKEIVGKIVRRDSMIAGVLSMPILPLAGFGDPDLAVAVRLKPRDLSKLLERPE